MGLFVQGLYLDSLSVYREVHMSVILLFSVFLLWRPFMVNNAARGLQQRISGVVLND